MQAREVCGSKGRCIRQTSLAGGQSIQNKSGHEGDVERRGTRDKMPLRPELLAYSHPYGFTMICEDVGVAFSLVGMISGKYMDVCENQYGRGG